MRISFSNNPIEKLSCYTYNKIEELSRVFWLMGKPKHIECRICGDVLDSRKDVFSPMQCGWGKVDKYTWVCHNCLCHRNFRDHIEQIDEYTRKCYEENQKKEVE